MSQEEKEVLPMADQEADKEANHMAADAADQMVDEMAPSTEVSAISAAASIDGTTTLNTSTSSKAENSSGSATTSNSSTFRRFFSSPTSTTTSSSSVSALLLGSAGSSHGSGTTITSTSAKAAATAAATRLQSWRQQAADALLLSDATVYIPPTAPTAMTPSTTTPLAHTADENIANGNGFAVTSSALDSDPAVPVAATTSATATNTEAPENEIVIAAATNKVAVVLAEDKGSAAVATSAAAAATGTAAPETTLTPRPETGTVPFPTDNVTTDTSAATSISPSSPTATATTTSSLSTSMSRYWNTYASTATAGSNGSGSTSTTTSATAVLAKAKALLLTKPIANLNPSDTQDTTPPFGVSDTNNTIHTKTTALNSTTGTDDDNDATNEAPSINKQNKPDSSTIHAAVPTTTTGTSAMATTTSAPTSSTSAWAVASTAASVVADSAQVFRGRYDDAAAALLAAKSKLKVNGTPLPFGRLQRPEDVGGDASSGKEGADAPTSPSASAAAAAANLDQATRIRQMTTATAAQSHYQQLTAGLASYEYLLLLGRGRLGVTLQQCYKLGAGVYVDALVHDGAAATSKLVYVGDVVISVGGISCQTTTSTIATVPPIIAAASRPVHITLSTSGCFNASNTVAATKSGDMKKDTCNAALLNHVDVAVAALQVCQSETLKMTTEIRMEESSDSATGPVNATGPTDDATRPLDTEQANVGDTTDMEVANSVAAKCSIPALWGPNNAHSLDALVNPALPSLEVRHAYWYQAAHRNTDNGLTLDFGRAALQTHDSVRHAIYNAMLLCVADGRRLVFWQRHVKEQQQEEALAHGGFVTNYSAMLSLFVGMFHYVDLHGIMSVSRRLDTARTIAHKFLLPTPSSESSTKTTPSSPSRKASFVPPPFDFHTVASDSSLRALEAALYNTDSADLPRTLFVDFQRAVFELLVDSSFLHFLVSEDFARMRAYLRNTAPFINVPIAAVMNGLTRTTKSTTSSPTTESPLSEAVQRASSKNYSMYCLVYLLCMMDQEKFGEHDDLLVEIDGISARRVRVENAASGFCACLFIRYRLLPLVAEAQLAIGDNTTSGDSPHSNVEDLASRLKTVYEQLWEFFVASGVGALIEGSRATEASNCLHTVRSSLESIKRRIQEPLGDNQMTLALLTEAGLIGELTALADELLLDYAVHLHPKFRAHKFHEWLCSEIATTDDVNDLDRSTVPNLPAGCVKRLMRKAKFPVGITPHQPSHDQTRGARKEESSTQGDRGPLASSLLNADVAIVFGTSLDSEVVSDSSTADSAAPNILRYTCQSVADIDGECAATPSSAFLDPSEVPVTLESYATIPLSSPKPFVSSMQEAWKSADGWEVSLINFMIPQADADGDDGGESPFVYGVSLLLQCSKADKAPDKSVDASTVQSNRGEQMTTNSDAPLSVNHPNDVVDNTTRHVPPNLSIFSKRLSERSWSRQLKDDAEADESPLAVGVVLLSKRNVLLAMRETLASLLRAFATGAGDGDSCCGSLIDLLGNFIHPDIESESLKSILAPFIRTGSKSWIERPIGSQRDEFLKLAGHQLLRFLPPIPLALTFVAALLEQKIVLISSRRSILCSAVSAIVELMKPLTWCHLLVPLVPAGLAGDLLQYPGPFILGLASEDHGVVELIRDLPEDVTLVDLDIGRVILAPSFAFDNEFGRGASAQDAAQILRSQVLYLAQSLGSVIGARLDPQAWCSDNPLVPMESSRVEESSATPFEKLCAVCHGFVQELLAGTTSCCYWIDETNSSSPTATSVLSTVLFDEDRFFRIKRSRESHGFVPLFATDACSAAKFALSLNEFDLVLELFLRCQSMNAYVGTLSREDMVFSL